MRLKSAEKITARLKSFYLVL